MTQPQHRKTHRPTLYVSESTPGGAFATGHGPLGRPGGARPDTSWPATPAATPAATTPELNRPLRSEREAREGRLAAAELDTLLGTRPLFALDTLAVWREAPPASIGAPRFTSPGRLVVTLNATGDLWIVAWQDAASGEVKAGQFHRNAAAAFEDLAGRCRRAGAHALRPGGRAA